MHFSFYEANPLQSFTSTCTWFFLRLLAKVVIHSHSPGHMLWAHETFDAEQMARRFRFGEPCSPSFITEARQLAVLDPFPRVLGWKVSSNKDRRKSAINVTVTWRYVWKLIRIFLFFEFLDVLFDAYSEATSDEFPWASWTTSSWTAGQGQVQLPTSKWRTLWYSDLRIDFFCVFFRNFQVISNQKCLGCVFFLILNSLGCRNLSSTPMAPRRTWCHYGVCGNWWLSEKLWNRLEPRERREFPMQRNSVPLGPYMTLWGMKKSWLCWS